MAPPSPSDEAFFRAFSSLLKARSAVDDDFLALDERRLVTCQEQGHGRDFRWSATATQRHLGGDLRDHGLLLLGREAEQQQAMIGVSMGPGLTAFTRMDRGESSTAAVRTSCVAAALVAA